jgi:hypothetical protein
MGAPPPTSKKNKKQAVNKTEQAEQPEQAVEQVEQTEQAVKQTEQTEQAVKQAEQAEQAVKQAEESNKSLVIISILDHIGNGTMLHDPTSKLDIDVYWPLFWKIQGEAFDKGFQLYVNYRKTNPNDALKTGYKLARKLGYTASIVKFTEKCQLEAFLYSFQHYIYHLNSSSPKEYALTQGYEMACNFGYMESEDIFKTKCTRQNEIDIIDRERRTTGDYTTPDSVILNHVKNRIRLLNAKEKIKR